MCESETTGYLFPQGFGKVSIRFAKNASGKEPARDFLMELKSKGNGLRSLAKYFDLFLVLFNKGVIYNNENFKKLKSTEGVHEFREFENNTRLFCFVENTEHGKEILLTHGSPKKESFREVRIDIDKAIRIKREDLLRRKR